MIKILKENKNNKDKSSIITIDVNDFYGELEKLLNQIKKLASSGHTFDVVIDPNSESESKFEIDGDGRFRINSIDVSYKDDEEDDQNEQ